MFGRLKLDASYFGQDDAHPLGVTRGVTSNIALIRSMAGARACALALTIRPCRWKTRHPAGHPPYTLSNSALNSWIGEEVRTIGVEGQLGMARHPAARPRLLTSV